MLTAGLVAAVACAGKSTDAAPSRRGPRGPEPADTAPAAATPARATPAVDRTGQPRALFLGTSLTAGLGLANPAADAWPAVIQQRADSEHVPLAVVNAGLSGETSAGALRRADWLLREKYDIVVIETGANDGLRGLDPDSTAANISRIVAKVRAANAATKIVIVQMESPTNLGPRYTSAFHALFGQVARETGTTLSPFLLDHVGGIAKLNQADGIHPTVEGARIAAANVWPVIRAAAKAARH